MVLWDVSCKMEDDDLRRAKTIFDAFELYFDYWWLKLDGGLKVA